MAQALPQLGVSIVPWVQTAGQIWVAERQRKTAIEQRRAAIAARDAALIQSGQSINVEQWLLPIGLGLALVLLLRK
jgi:hypothetical protein